MRTAKNKLEFEHRTGDPPYRLTRTRRLTAGEAARLGKIREAVMQEFPPTPGSPAAIAAGLRALNRQLKNARQAAGLTLAAVAKRSGIDKAALSRLENGHHDNPTLETILRYLAAIGKDIEWRFVNARSGKQ
jgi:DNA-binding XRE family transcriptional regulator